LKGNDWIHPDDLVITNNGFQVTLDGIATFKVTSNKNQPSPLASLGTSQDEIPIIVILVSTLTGMIALLLAVLGIRRWRN